MDEKLFIADAMLGKFARWIRLCGFDAFYADSSLTDSEIIGMATESDRIVITRDRELALRTGESLFIKNDDPFQPGRNGAPREYSHHQTRSFPVS